MSLREETSTFLRSKAQERSDAAQRVALQLLCGLDLEATLDSSHEIRRNALQRIERLLCKERLKALRHHWSYDLNRHIALKEARDRLAEIVRRTISPLSLGTLWHGSRDEMTKDSGDSN